MGYPDNLLSRGERVVLHKHPHWKTLIFPVLSGLVVIGGAAALIAWSRTWKDSGFTAHTPWLIGIIAVGVILFVWLTVAKFFQWQAEHFVLSTGHVFFRTGILKRREHQIPLGRIQNMEVNVTFWGRLLGYGTLIVESAAEQPLEFSNVASLPKVQSILNQLIADDRTGLMPGEPGGPPAGRAPDEYNGQRGVLPPPVVDGPTTQQTRSYPTEQAPQGYPPTEGYPPAQGYPQGQGYPPPPPGR